MDIQENIREGVKSIQANKLRTILTAAIIAIGITSLVGILTAIDGIKDSINESFSNLGSNTFDIESKRQDRRSQEGKKAKVHPPVRFDEFQKFKEEFRGPGTVSVNTVLTWNAEVKYGSEKTNPNILIRGGDENFLIGDGYDIGQGRSFSHAELEKAGYVAIIGSEVQDALFKNNVSPIGKKITFLGTKFRVIGTLKEQGAAGTGNTDRRIVVPLNTARLIGVNTWFGYEATIAVANPIQMDEAMGTARGLMRAVRGDRPKEEDSFEIRANMSIAERLDDMMGYLRIGGFTIGIITLIGASIGLMNIMLVSVTERTREIGVRKALGATPLKIRQQFLIEALVICQMGGAGGILLGIGIGNLINSFIGSGNFIIPWIWILFGVAVGMFVGLLSGSIPAFKASRLDPIDSLRFE